MSIAYSTLMSVLNWNNLANFVGAPNGGTMYIVLSDDWDITDADFKVALAKDLLDQTSIQLPGTGLDLTMTALFIQLGADGQYLNGGEYTIVMDDEGKITPTAVTAFPAGEPDEGDTLLIFPSSFVVAASQS